MRQGLSKVIISGGGTGGHIHPALAIADEIKRRHPDVSIRFVGALGRMEMDKVPKAGYEIDGLWISGVDRKLTSTRNLLFPFKLISSLWKARRILKRHKPQVVIGVGGFASGPLLDRAARMGIPTLIQEQNSFPGITNRLLAQRVDRICAGLPGMERWFPKDKLVETGNPLRESVCALANQGQDPAEAKAHWGIEPDVPIAFVMGGSLGAQSMNRAVQHLLTTQPTLQNRGYHLLWQCGARYHADMTAWLEAHDFEAVTCLGFIDRMDLAYRASDVIASRAGAMSIAELALVGKPTILVPSPHVAEDHQTHNARSLSERGGAVLMPDTDVVANLGSKLDELFKDETTRKDMASHMKGAARPEAAQAVVDQVELLIAGS